LGSLQYGVEPKRRPIMNLILKYLHEVLESEPPSPVLARSQTVLKNQITDNLLNYFIKTHPYNKEEMLSILLDYFDRR
jgi:hypothetical protein